MLREWKKQAYMYYWYQISIGKVKIQLLLFTIGFSLQFQNNDHDTSSVACITSKNPEFHYHSA